MKVFLIVLACFILFFFILGAIDSDTPEAKEKSKDRNAIKHCWEEQKKKSNSESASRFIAGACEMMEGDFKKKFGLNP